MLREPASVLFAHGAAAGVPRPVRAAAARGADTARRCSGSCPGIVAMTCLMGASFTGAEPDRRDAHRLPRTAAGLARSAGPSLLVGRALKEVVPMLMQTAIILAVVTAVQLRPAPRRRTRRRRDPRPVLGRDRLAVLRARTRLGRAGVVVLDGPADADLPVPAAGRDAAPARRRPRLAAGRRPTSTRSPTSSRPSARSSPAPGPPTPCSPASLAAAIVAALGVTVGVRTMQRSS